MNRVKRKLIQLKEHYGNSHLMTSTFECSSEPNNPEENTNRYNNDSHLYSQDIELVSSKEEDIYMNTQKFSVNRQKDLGIMTHHGYRQRRGNNTVKHSRVSSMQYDDEKKGLEDLDYTTGSRIGG